jgi:hypothetical protein
MFTHKYILKNQVNFAILLFVLLFVTIHWARPSMFYLPNGAFRPFGVGYRHKTVFPLWIVAIVLGIFCYLFVRYFVLYSL